MMNIKAIPTEYNGVQFRSRLEARWAAFFDQMKWRWAYEPFDLDGWIPDFVVGPDFETGAYVEVKPIDWGEIVIPFSERRKISAATQSQWKEANYARTPELAHARNMVPSTSRGFVICGLRPEFNYRRAHVMPSQEWLEKASEEEMGLEWLTQTHDAIGFDHVGPIWEPRWKRWNKAIISKKYDRYDLCVGSQNDHPGLMTGAPDFTNGDEFLDDGEIEAMWNRAGNAVQWKSPHRNSLIPA